MRAHIKAIKAILAADGLTAFWVDVAEKPTYPYVLLWGPAWGRGETTLASSESIDVHLHATCVAENPDLALDLAARVRGLLDGSLPAVEGWAPELKYLRSEIVGVDRAVTLPNSNRHPGYAVDTYRLVSDPA